MNSDNVHVFDIVADLTVMLALMAMRRAKEGMDIVHKGQVRPHGRLSFLTIPCDRN
jgi:lactate dehydrogenase-like 2-hydroxyacid dehydrogenase